MWRVGRQLLPCARFRLLKVGQGTPGVGPAASSAHQRSAKEASMTAFAHTSATASKPVFCDFPLDRAGHIRDDPQAQAKLSDSDNAILVLLNDSTVLCESAAKDASEALTLSKLCPLREHQNRVKGPLLFLGVSNDGAPYFAAQASEASQDSVPQESMSWVDLRKHSGDLAGADASLAGTAHGVLAWHKSSAYSAETGKEMVPGHAGWSRLEDSTNKPTYARLDPAVITIVECNGHILLGRNLKWVEGRFSALAGFVEMGESLEQAASREVFEEAGIAVAPDDLRYIESQPWPFPRSLMIAFRGKVDACCPTGEYTDGAVPRVVLQSSGARAAAAESGITQQEIQEYLGAQCAPTAKQEDEMADVRWFHWQWVARVLGWVPPQVVPEAAFHIPGPSSLAHRMIKEIVREQMRWAGAVVPECIIEEGRFKYVLLRVTSADAQHSKLVVRGYKRCEYHNDVVRVTKEDLRGSGLHVGVIGGGRILHEPGSKPCVTVFGYSSAFGPAVHEVSAVLIQRAFPMYDADDVAVSYEGY